MIFHSKQEFFISALNLNDHNRKKLWAGMNELTGLKPKTCINHIEGENGDMIKKNIYYCKYS